MCVILLILDKQSVSKWKSVANESSVSWFDKANVKNWFFITPSFPLFTRLITIWSCYTMHSRFFFLRRFIYLFVQWSGSSQTRFFSLFFARNAKTPIVIYDLRVWTWDNVLCFIASILIQAIKFIQFLFVAVGSSSSSSLRYRQSLFLCLPYRPCHSRIFLIHFSFLEQLNKCFYIDYMHLIYSLKCPLSFIWPFFFYLILAEAISTHQKLRVHNTWYTRLCLVHCTIGETS